MVHEIAIKLLAESATPEGLTVLEVLFPGSLSYMWASAYGGSQHGFSQSERLEKTPKWKSQFSITCSEM